MIPINSASEFKSFLDDLREWTISTRRPRYKELDYYAFTLYAKFPDCQHNSFMDYDGDFEFVNENCEKLLKVGLVPYIINEQTVLENNGEAIIKEREIFTYAPCDQVVFFGVDIYFNEQEFLEWRASKSSSE